MRRTERLGQVQLGLEHVDRDDLARASDAGTLHDR
jgi:hypothetical protein